VEASLRQFYDTLSEKDRRRYAATEAKKLGHGGIGYLAKLFDCSRRTIENGIAELASLDSTETRDRIRRKGGGRKSLTKADSIVTQNFF
jgi:transcriptional antiterminator